MNKKILIVNANYYQDISSGLLKNALKTIPKKYKMKGKVKGFMPFDDSDLYKIIEGASNSLISSPNEKLERLIDELIGIIKIGQEEDGYLTTWRTWIPLSF